MKNHLVVAMAATASLAQAESDFIRQIQLFDTGVSVYDTWVDTNVPTPAGTMMSLPVTGEHGAKFQLWAIGLNEDYEGEYFNVAEKVVGIYPRVTLEILSDDPNPVLRTRADKPFVFTVSVEGLITGDPTVPMLKQVVELHHDYHLYSPDDWRPLAGDEHAGTYDYFLEFYENRKYVHPALYHSFPMESGADRHQAQGKETLTVYTYPNDSGVQHVLASGSIEIWPKATATLTGVEANKTYLSLPKVTAECESLYPKSLTYAEVFYQGQETGIRVLEIAHDASVPRHYPATPLDLSTAIDQDGVYTIRLFTDTPFGERELLAETDSFIIDRTIEVRAGVTTTE